MPVNMGPHKVAWSTEVAALVHAGDMSAASITSSPTNVHSCDTVGWQIKWSGGTGTLSYEVSNNYDRQANTGDWTELSAAAFSPSLTHPAGSASSTTVRIPDCDVEWVRVKYTRTSGSGNLEAWVKGKGA